MFRVDNGVCVCGFGYGVLDVGGVGWGFWGIGFFFWFELLGVMWMDLEGML